AVPLPQQAKMAVVLDDWGNNYSVLKLAKDLKRPVTLAILPNLPHSRRIAEEAYQSKLGVMLHMPMQATSPNQPKEPHTITTELSEKAVLQYLDQAVDSIPHIEGVNNHQGSAATSDARIMKIVLKRLKERGLFFVDSHVIATSVAARIAKETGIRFAKRHVFIDNVATVPAVKAELLKAKDLALKKGEIVVIGHDKKATLQALLETAPEIERSGVRFVLVRELVKVQKA
ncbi:MAG TPA: divergent polysaccharide deacetylase family protein, partial [Candidatus Omnitrophota bacterium]|nr:divergent polysaccharide deacetylase family protein [Candidatus Omnitrophota bacterium]